MPDLDVVGGWLGLFDSRMVGSECPGSTDLPNTEDHCLSLWQQHEASSPPSGSHMFAEWHRLPWLVVFLSRTFRSMALREGLETGANRHPGTHHAWITNFCPGAEHSCQSCEGTAIPCQGPLPRLLLGSCLPSVLP